MDNQVIAANLVRLRKHRGKTQVEVADASGLSRAAYRAVEKGRSLPRAENLRAIAAALQVPVRELVTPVPRLEHARFRSLKKLKSRDQVLVEVARWLKDYTDLEQLVGDGSSHDLGVVWRALKGVQEDRAIRAAEIMREHLGLAPGQPVHDVCGLFEAHGIKVHAIEVASDAFLGLSVAAEDGGPAIIVNNWPRLAVEHWIFSAVHELGHLVLHRPAYVTAEESEDVDEEKEAEVFASHFLMPHEAFLKEWNDARGHSLINRVVKVKRIFKVSWRAVVYRACEPLSQEQQVQVWKRVAVEYRARTGRRLLKLTEPASVPQEVFGAPRIIARSGNEMSGLDAADFDGDRLALLVRRAFEQGEISLCQCPDRLYRGRRVVPDARRAPPWSCACAAGSTRGGGGARRGPVRAVGDHGRGR